MNCLNVTISEAYYCSIQLNDRLFRIDVLLIEIQNIKTMSNQIRIVIINIIKSTKCIMNLVNELHLLFNGIRLIVNSFTMLLL